MQSVDRGQCLLLLQWNTFILSVWIYGMPMWFHCTSQHIPLVHHHYFIKLKELEIIIVRIPNANLNRLQHELFPVSLFINEIRYSGIRIISEDFIHQQCYLLVLSIVARCLMLDGCLLYFCFCVLLFVDWLALTSFHIIFVINVYLHDQTVIDLYMRWTFINWKWHFVRIKSMKMKNEEWRMKYEA